MAPERPPTYAYGDNDVAGDRLELLAEVFAPSTASFIAAAAPGEVVLAVDLGCGPGHTTRLLASVTGATHAVGLDLSAAFVARAATALAELGDRVPAGSIEFAVHDVTSVPFPVAGPIDVVFARYLLAHLPEPDALLGRWLDQVRVGGRLLVEEIVAIDTGHPVFGRYIELVTALSAAQGTDLLVGGALGHSWSDRDEAAGGVHDETVTITPDPALVARLFLMNLGVWRHGPWAEAELDADELNSLAAELAALVESPPPHGAIAWRHRQLAYERR